jgi:hypothetical protein
MLISLDIFNFFFAKVTSLTQYNARDKTDVDLKTLRMLTQYNIRYVCILPFKACIG